MRERVSDAGNFGIRYSTKFESTYKRILRTHYRNRPADAERFESLFDALEEALVLDPSPPGSVRAPWPGKLGRPNWDLYKFKFFTPGLDGAAGEDRLLYFVDQQTRTVCLLWVYTHEEYKGQPPTKEFKKVVSAAARHIMGRA